MPSNVGDGAVNRLLESLPAGGRRRMLDGCETVQLALSEVLYRPRQPLVHVYFPIGSFISLIMQIDESACIEVGMVGSEGMFGVPLALGVAVSPVRAVVQGAGPALRMESAKFCREIARDDALRRAVDRYIAVQMSQLAQASGCTRFHLVEARLARWLLMTQDRAHQDCFDITHEILAFMLGVRRVGITKAAGALQRQGLIAYRRGRITVLDRRGLKAASCSCYNADRQSYERTLG